MAATADPTCSTTSTITSPHASMLYMGQDHRHRHAETRASISPAGHLSPYSSPHPSHHGIDIVGMSMGGHPYSHSHPLPHPYPNPRAHAHPFSHPSAGLGLGGAIGGAHRGMGPNMALDQLNAMGFAGKFQTPATTSHAHRFEFATSW